MSELEIKQVLKSEECFETVNNEVNEIQNDSIIINDGIGDNDFVDIETNIQCAELEDSMEEIEFNPDQFSMLLTEGDGHPVCFSCSMMFASIDSYEYHILRHHLRYQPFRCLTCGTRSFYIESEGLHHLKTHHPDLKALTLGKYTDYEKEAMFADLCAQTEFIVPNEPMSKFKFTSDIRIATATQLSKFYKCRFSVPNCLRTTLSLQDKSTDPYDDVMENVDFDKNYLMMPTTTTNANYFFIQDDQFVYDYAEKVQENP